MTPERIAELRDGLFPLREELIALLDAAEENARLRRDYPGGDQEAQALAWSAVYRKCRDCGMPNFFKDSGRESVLAYISQIVGQVNSLRADLAEAVEALDRVNGKDRYLQTAWDKAAVVVAKHKGKQ